MQCCGARRQEPEGGVRGEDDVDRLLSFFLGARSIVYFRSIMFSISWRMAESLWCDALSMS